MRMTTILSVAVLGVSTAALAQVSQAPQANTTAANVETANEVVEAKLPPADTADTPAGNTADAAPPPGEPEGSTSAPPRG